MSSSLREKSVLHPSSSSTVAERSIRLPDDALDVVLEALVSTIELRSPALLTPLLLLLLPAVLLLYSQDEQEDAGRRDLYNNEIRIQYYSFRSLTEENKK